MQFLHSMHRSKFTAAYGIARFPCNSRVFLLILGFISGSLIQLEVHGRARREAARRGNTEWTVNLAIRNSSPNNATCQMTPKTVL